MQKGIRQYCSIIFLFLLLFPIAEKGIHALAHGGEEHCSITDQHFHEQEHECSICDFTLTDSNEAPENEIRFVSCAQTISFVSFSRNTSALSAFSDIPSRAPPVV